MKKQSMMGCTQSNSVSPPAQDNDFYYSKTKFHVNHSSDVQLPKSQKRRQFFDVSIVHINVSF